MNRESKNFVYALSFFRRHHFAHINEGNTIFHIQHTAETHQRERIEKIYHQNILKAKEIIILTLQHQIAQMCLLHPAKTIITIFSCLCHRIIIRRQRKKNWRTECSQDA